VEGSGVDGTWQFLALCPMVWPCTQLTNNKCMPA
jgi:hypothetical protein